MQPDGLSPILLSSIWRPANGAHAIQRASALVTFSEAVTSMTLERMADAVRPVASRLGLLKEEPMSSALFEVREGAVPRAVHSQQAGIVFSQVFGKNVVQSLSITLEAVRFDTHSYTRWVAFSDQFRELTSKIFPIISNSVSVTQVGLEYIDVFVSSLGGDTDVSMIIDRKSPSIAGKAFSRREPFHSHAGWFENSSSGSRRLINTDVNVSDAASADGPRRIASVRTYEAEVLPDKSSARARELAGSQEAILALLDSIHLSLKGRLRTVLTRPASDMISLGH